MRTLLAVLILALLLPLTLFAQTEEITDPVLADLMKQRDDVKAQMAEAKEAGDNDKYDQLNASWEGLETKITARYDLIKNSKKEAKRLSDEGSSYRRDKKYAQAEASYTKVLKYTEFIGEDKIPDIKGIIGFCQERQKLYPKASDTYQEVIDIQPDNANAYAGKGRCAARMGKDSEAVNLFKKSLELNPDDAKNYFFIAQSYEKINMKPDAEINYALAAEKDPAYYKAYYQLGVVRYSMKKYTPAVEALKSAVELKKNYYQAFTLMAQIYNTVGNYSAAIDAAESAINIKANYAQAHFEKGVALEKSERYNQAIKAFENCLNDRTWRDQANYHINLIKDKYLKE